MISSAANDIQFLQHLYVVVLKLLERLESDHFWVYDYIHIYNSRSEKLETTSAPIVSSLEMKVHWMNITIKRSVWAYLLAHSVHY